LQGHDAIGLGPSPIIADTHADDTAHGAPDRKTEVARFEITLFQVLEGALRIVLRMPGQMHLVILAHDFSIAIDQNRRVEVMPIGRELGITERQTDAKSAACSNSGRVAAFGISRSNQASTSA